MAPEVEFAPASGFTLDTLGDIFTQSFEGYAYAMAVTAAMLAQRIRAEQLDLLRSIIMQAGGVPAGIALVGLRAERAWCGGFGVVAAFRGRRLAPRLASAMLDQARQAGARSFTLEVLTKNERAIKTYFGAGMRIQRDLRILEWRRDAAWAPAAQGTSVDTWEPRRLLASFEALHRVPAAWQRDLPALLTRAHLQGLALADAGRPQAYLLFQAGADGRAQIADLAATQPEQAHALLLALQQRYQQIVSVNEPADSPLIGAYEARGFVEADRQHELALDLA